MRWFADELKNMAYSSTRTGVGWTETATRLLALLVIVGCSTSYRAEPHEDASVSTTDAGDASSDIASPPADSGSDNDSSSNQKESCERDLDCPTSDPCYRAYCGSDGQCSREIVANGTSCASPEETPWICLNGVCQESRCGDGYVDHNLSEDCDDGNDDTSDDCVECDEARCGDGYVQAGVELCDYRSDRFCKEDCTPTVCGDGVIDEPQENCEPDLSTGPCNQFCRISDTPEWLVEVRPPAEPFDVPGINPLFSPMLLLDSEGSPIVIYMQVYIDTSPFPTNVPVVDKYDADGQLIWKWTGNAVVTIYGATVDSNDNIIVVGYSLSPEGPWLLKLDANGVEQWSTTVSNANEVFVGVMSDGQTNLAVMSTSVKESQGFSYPWYTSDLRFEFYDSDGTNRPVERLVMPGVYISGESLSSGMIDNVRRNLLAGATRNDTLFEPRLILLDSNASEVWDEPVSYDPPMDKVCFLKALTTNKGDIVALGASRPEDEENVYFSSFWLDRFGPDGTARWSEATPLRDDTSFFFYFVYPSASDARAGLDPHRLRFPMALDSQDNIYLALNNAEHTDGNQMILIDKYGPDGSLMWERPIYFDSGYPGYRTTIDISYAAGLAVNSSGAVYVLSTNLAIPALSGFLARMAGNMRPTYTTGLWLHKWTPPDS